MAEVVAIPGPDGKFVTPSNTGELTRDKAHHLSYTAFKPIYALPPEQRSREEQGSSVAPNKGEQRDLLAAHDQATKLQQNEE